MRTLILLCLGVLLAACTRDSADFSRFAGDWKFDQQGTFREQIAVAERMGQRIFAEKLVNSAQQQSLATKEPLHSNIRISNARITGIDALLEPQYDIVHAALKGGILIARVRYHEERHDQGDFVEMLIHVRMAGSQLILEQHIDEMPVPIVFAFVRK